MKPETAQAVEEYLGNLRAAVRTLLPDDEEEGREMIDLNEAASAERESIGRNAWALSEEEPENLNAVPAMEPQEKAFASVEDFTSVPLALDEFYIKEIGKHVYLRYLTAAEVDRYRQSMIVGKGNNIQINQTGARAKLAVMALARADGTRLFQDKDIHQVMKWHSILLERIADRVKAKNGITDEDMGGDDQGN